MSARLARSATAGTLAAAVWAAQQPLDKRIFRCSYDDVELLGKLVAHDRWWRLAGILMHLGNGALFGAAYTIIEPRLPGPGWARGLLAAQIENFGLWPLGRLSDRHHPARDELPRLGGNGRALAQATWRHTIFGLVLGVAERRLSRSNPRAPAARTSSGPSPSTDGRCGIRTSRAGF